MFHRCYGVAYKILAQVSALYNFTTYLQFPLSSSCSTHLLEGMALPMVGG